MNQDDEATTKLLLVFMFYFTLYVGWAAGYESGKSYFCHPQRSIERCLDE